MRLPSSALSVGTRRRVRRNRLTLTSTSFPDLAGMLYYAVQIGEECAKSRVGIPDVVVTPESPDAGNDTARQKRRADVLAELLTSSTARAFSVAERTPIELHNAILGAAEAGKLKLVNHPAGKAALTVGPSHAKGSTASKARAVELASRSQSTSAASSAVGASTPSPAPAPTSAAAPAAKPSGRAPRWSTSGSTAMLKRQRAVSSDAAATSSRRFAGASTSPAPTEANAAAAAAAPRVVHTRIYRVSYLGHSVPWLGHDVEAAAWVHDDVCGDTNALVMYRSHDTSAPSTGAAAAGPGAAAAAAYGSRLQQAERAQLLESMQTSVGGVTVQALGTLSTESAEAHAEQVFLDMMCRRYPKVTRGRIFGYHASLNASTATPAAGSSSSSSSSSSSAASSASPSSSLRMYMRAGFANGTVVEGGLDAASGWGQAVAGIACAASTTYAAVSAGAAPQAIGKSSKQPSKASSNSSSSAADPGFTLRWASGRPADAPKASSLSAVSSSCAGASIAEAACASSSPSSVVASEAAVASNTRRIGGGHTTPTMMADTVPVSMDDEDGGDEEDEQGAHDGGAAASGGLGSFAAADRMYDQQRLQQHQHKRQRMTMSMGVAVEPLSPLLAEHGQAMKPAEGAMHCTSSNSPAAVFQSPAPTAPSAASSSSSSSVVSPPDDQHALRPYHYASTDGNANHTMAVGTPSPSSVQASAHERNLDGDFYAGHDYSSVSPASVYAAGTGVGCAVRASGINSSNIDENEAAEAAGDDDDMYETLLNSDGTPMRTMVGMISRAASVVPTPNKETDVGGNANSPGAHAGYDRRHIGQLYSPQQLRGSLARHGYSCFAGGDGDDDNDTAAAGAGDSSDLDGAALAKGRQKGGRASYASAYASASSSHDASEYSSGMSSAVTTALPTPVHLGSKGVGYAYTPTAIATSGINSTAKVHQQLFDDEARTTAAGAGGGTSLGTYEYASSTPVSIAAPVSTTGSAGVDARGRSCSGWQRHRLTFDVDVEVLGAHLPSTATAATEALPSPSPSSGSTAGANAAAVRDGLTSWLRSCGTVSINCNIANQSSASVGAAAGMDACTEFEASSAPSTAASAALTFRFEQAHVLAVTT